MDILLVEDDSAIASGLVYALEHEGYAVTHTTTAADANACARSGDPAFALAIIDLGLPDASGFDVVATLSCPFLFLTAVDDEANTVRGFDLGADDYITKPFRLRELLARVKAVIRRNSGDGDVLNIRDISIDTKAATVLRSGTSVDLTSMEYKLLLVFAQNRGQVLTRAQIIDALWDTDGNFVEDNTLTVYVKRLREKLGENIIETVRRIGYRCS